MEPPGYTTLPRGRHRLTREQVAASQRDRLLHGMIEVVADQGYARSSVADVLKRARVSRETFYEHFTDKRHCFLDAYQRAAGEMVAVVAAAVEDAAGGTPLERFSAGLTAYLAGLARDGARARVFLLEIYAAGPEAALERYAVQRRFIGIITTLLLSDPRWRRLPDPEFACRMVVGGIAGLVSGKVADHRTDELPELHGPIVEHVRALLDAAPVPPAVPDERTPE
ncbi:TetR/AcrR family transcriptional regulator [Actinomadura parmotrematis]|uniref:TetR/AcrR family transcriptional regulator n=1 Tax=Actinomadura parmotrematis TaxID=2864039 RepID=A0ABS7FU25_9ACTN|nr:TetR/AcrR family transcriptional regulator [Actinomadura parmotrematis]MBW8483038.1 TetR/AcrR family transcriptional regulator [Actinomadura parmotrematis]